jgi:anhydro-N-acetylmuramic acid kinase
MLVVGLMSGTSLDGITAALVDIEAEKTLQASPPKLRIRLLESETFSFPPGAREELLCLSESGDVPKLCRMNFWARSLPKQY